MWTYWSLCSQLSLDGAVSISALKINTELYDNTCLIYLVCSTRIIIPFNVFVTKTKILGKRVLCSESVFWKLPVKQNYLITRSERLVLMSLPAVGSVQNAYHFFIRLIWVITVTHIYLLSDCHNLTRLFSHGVFKRVSVGFVFQSGLTSLARHAKMKGPLVLFFVFVVISRCWGFECPKQCKCGETIRCKVRDLTILKEILPANITRL